MRVAVTHGRSDTGALAVERDRTENWRSVAIEDA
jgi:hypothetical protein